MACAKLNLTCKQTHIMGKVEYPNLHFCSIVTEYGYFWYLIIVFDLPGLTILYAHASIRVKASL